MAAASCPQCHKPVSLSDQQYGTLCTCPSCRAVFFVGWDGQPELTAEHEPEPAAEEPAAFSPPEVPEEPTAFEPPIAQEEASFAPPESSWTPPENAEEPTDQNAQSWNATEGESVEGEAPAEWTPPDEPTRTDVQGDEPIANNAWSPAAPVETTGAEDMAEIAAYGNSDSSAGPMVYTVHISGIELAETSERLREAMTDSRFNWDVDELMETVRNGQLSLRGLNPTKASVLVSRIKALSLDVRWTQEIYESQA